MPAAGPQIPRNNQDLCAHPVWPVLWEAVGGLPRRSWDKADKGNRKKVPGKGKSPPWGLFFPLVPADGGFISIFNTLFQPFKRIFKIRVSNLFPGAIFDSTFPLPPFHTFPDRFLFRGNFHFWEFCFLRGSAAGFTEDKRNTPNIQFGKTPSGGAYDQRSFSLENLNPTGVIRLYHEDSLF